MCNIKSEKVINFKLVRKLWKSDTKKRDGVRKGTRKRQLVDLTNWTFQRVPDLKRLTYEYHIKPYKETGKHKRRLIVDLGL